MKIDWEYWHIKCVWFWRSTVVPEGKVILWLVLAYYLFTEVAR